MALPKICPCALKTSRASSRILKWNAGVSNFLRTLHFWCVDSNRPVPSQGLKKKRVKWSLLICIQFVHGPSQPMLWARFSTWWFLKGVKIFIHSLFPDAGSRPSCFDVSKQMLNLMEAFFKIWCLLIKPKISELWPFFYIPVNKCIH